MSDSTDTPSDAPVDDRSPVSPFHYVVVREGHGHPIGTRITDDAVIHELELHAAPWAVRVAKES